MFCLRGDGELESGQNAKTAQFVVEEIEAALACHRLRSLRHAALTLDHPGLPLMSLPPGSKDSCGDIDIRYYPDYPTKFESKGCLAPSEFLKLGEAIRALPAEFQLRWVALHGDHYSGRESDMYEIDECFGEHVGEEETLYIPPPIVAELFVKVEFVIVGEEDSLSIPPPPCLLNCRS